MSETTVSPEELPETSPFAGLSDEERQRIAKEMQRTSFSSGQLIFARGDDGQSLYVVLKGRVRLSVLTAEGRELSFTHAEPGSTFGEIAMLDGKPRTADATAITKVEAATLQRDAFRRIINAVPQFTQNLIEMLCGRLRAADHQLEGVALHRIEVRLARFLVIQAEKEQVDENEDGMIPLNIGMSQGELALLLGASRPKVNTALTLLEDQGAIKRDGAKLLCDLEELSIIAELDETHDFA